MREPKLAEGCLGDDPWDSSFPSYVIGYYGSPYVAYYGTVRWSGQDNPVMVELFDWACDKKLNPHPVAVIITNRFAWGTKKPFDFIIGSGTVK